MLLLLGIDLFLCNATKVWGDFESRFMSDNDTFSRGSDMAIVPLSIIAKGYYGVFAVWPRFLRRTFCDDIALCAL